MTRTTLYGLCEGEQAATGFVLSYYIDAVSVADSQQAFHAAGAVELGILYYLVTWLPCSEE